MLPGAADAAVLRLRGTNKAIALTTDCNPRYCYLDPYVGAQIAVAEAARNLSCVGATPLAVTDCLNFANPEKPDGFWQFRRAVEGLADACEAFGTPVISGNVSFYNETPERAILPTPTVGMVGLLPDADKRVTLGFKSEGDHIYLIAAVRRRSAAASTWPSFTGRKSAPARPRHGGRETLQALLREASSQGLLRSAHDISEGGVAVALAECCLAGGLCATVLLPSERAARAAVRRAPACVMVTVSPANTKRMRSWLDRTA